MLRATATDSSAYLEKLNEELKIKDKELMEIRASMTAEIGELKKQFQEEIEEKSKYIEEISLDTSQKSMIINKVEKEISELKSIVESKDEEIKHLVEKNSGDKQWRNFYNYTIIVHMIILTVVWFFRITVCSYIIRAN